MARIKSAVVVANPTTGEIVTPRENNPTYGVIRIDQVITTTVNNYRNKQTRTAFISGETEDLLDDEYQAGEVYGVGFIQRKMSFTPFYDGQQPILIPANDDNPEKIILFDENGNKSETGKQAYAENVWVDGATLATHKLDVWVKPLPKTVEKKAKLNVTGLQDL